MSDWQEYLTDEEREQLEAAEGVEKDWLEGFAISLAASRELEKIMESKARALGFHCHTSNCASLDTDILCNCGGQSIIDGIIRDPDWTLKEKR